MMGTDLDFKLLFERAPALLLVLKPDEKFTILAATDAYLRATLTEREHVVGRGLFDVFPDDPNDPSATGTRNLRASLERVIATRVADTMAVQKYDIPRPAADGGGFEERYWSPINAPGVGNTGELLYIIHRVEDITEYVRLADEQERVRRQSQALAQRTEVMEAEIVRRSRELDVARRNLQELNDDLRSHATELEAFSYSVSHDLRAPLRSIDGFSQALLEDYADRLDETGRQYLGRVRAATVRMGTLIDDLLKLSRVTRAEMTREPVDVSALTESIIADLRREFPEREVEVVIEPGILVEGDSKLLHIALDNLLSNAWKFTGQRRPARIEFGLREVGGERACFVRDNGAGFDMAYANKLFGPFQRLHAPTEFPGTGIGLAIVHRIILRHGGRIWVEAAVGNGATFYFTLPLQRLP